MRGLFYSFLGYFLTPAGLVLLGALDAVDGVLSAARHRLHCHSIDRAKSRSCSGSTRFSPRVGSIIGAAGTFWIGRKVGEHGLARFVKPSRLKRVQERVGDGAAMTVAALAIIPPPFPFTAFVLTSGAARVNPWTFFVTLGVVRSLRFVVEGALAAHYGKGIIGWMQSTTFTVIVGAMAAIADHRNDRIGNRALQKYEARPEPRPQRAGSTGGCEPDTPCQI